MRGIFAWMKNWSILLMSKVYWDWNCIARSGDHWLIQMYYDLMQMHYIHVLFQYPTIGPSKNVKLASVTAVYTNQLLDRNLSSTEETSAECHRFYLWFILFIDLFFPSKDSEIFPPIIIGDENSEGNNNKKNPHSLWVIAWINHLRKPLNLQQNIKIVHE